MNRKKVFWIIYNLIMAGFVFYAWGTMMFVFENGQLSSRGLGSLKYFTVLSNLLAGITALIWCGSAKRGPHWVNVLKFVSTLAVTLTFTMVVVFLGPLFGYGIMFVGPSFWMHLIVPVMSAVELLLRKGADQISRKEALLAEVPLLLYGTFYLGNYLINGPGTWPARNDWYGIMTWGFPVGIVIYAILIAFIYSAGRLYLKAAGKLRKL